MATVPSTSRGTSEKRSSISRASSKQPATEDKKTVKKDAKANKQTNKESKSGRGPFSWTAFLDTEPNIKTAPVSSFRHAPVSSIWNDFIVIGLLVEVRNHDYHVPSASGRVVQDVYWIASVVRIAGYFIKLRMLGYEDDASADFWLHIKSPQLHSVGWCASQGKPLIPPTQIFTKVTDWRDFLLRRLTGSKTLPENFHMQLKENMKSDFRVGMKLEVVDKKRISSVRVATIDKIIGGRLCVVYDHFEDPDTTFWCHERSPLIHPIGWAQIVGHELRSTSEYALSSLEKIKNKKWDENDCDFSYFPQLSKLPTYMDKDLKFLKNMKLEAIDPLNLSTICVATVTKVLRNNYLMIGIDGMMAEDGSDWFCYHASSGNIFPAGFSKLHNINLTPPLDYEEEFEWFNYLNATNSIQAPVSLFNKELPDQEFKEGMYLEAVDLIEPRLICVAMIKKVVGRLLKIHFNGWGELYDQWCDCESVELFPLGWCELVGYPLEPPRDDNDPYSNVSSVPGGFVFDNAMKKRGKSGYKGRYKKRKRNQTGSSDKRGSQAMDDDSTATGAYEDDNEDCTVFNSIIETQDWGLGGESDDATDLPDPPPVIIDRGQTTNTVVTIKPSPLQFDKITELSSLKISRVHPEKWSISDVAHFLQSNDCMSYAQSFVDNQITGRRLLKMTRDEIVRLTFNKLGPSLKIYALVDNLRKKHGPCPKDELDD